MFPVSDYHRSRLHVFNPTNFSMDRTIVNRPRRGPAGRGARTAARADARARVASCIVTCARPSSYPVGVRSLIAIASRPNEACLVRCNVTFSSPGHDTTHDTGRTLKDRSQQGRERVIATQAMHWRAMNMTLSGVVPDTPVLCARARTSMALQALIRGARNFD